MGITIPIGKHEWCFSSIERVPRLIFDAQGRSTREFKPKHEWDKVDNEGREANVKALFKFFLMKFVQMSFVG